MEDSDFFSPGPPFFSPQKKKKNGDKTERRSDLRKMAYLSHPFPQSKFTLTFFLFSFSFSFNGFFAPHVEPLFFILLFFSLFKSFSGLFAAKFTLFFFFFYSFCRFFHSLLLTLNHFVFLFPL